MKQKIISLSLALLMLLAAAGCGQAQPDPAEPSDNAAETPAPSESPAVTETPAPKEDPEEAAKAAERLAKFTRAYEKFSPDTEVMRVDGRPVLWSEYFCWLYNAAALIDEQLGVTDWSADFPVSSEDAESTSYNSYVRSYATLNCLQLAVLANQAEALDAGLTSEQEAELDETFDRFRSEEDYAQTLAENFLTEEELRRQYAADSLYQNLYEKTFGKDGELCSDADAVQYVTDQGYMNAKHILFKTVDDSNQPLDEAAIAKKKAEAENVLAQLQAASAAELPTLFDSLMKQYTEDPGSLSFPNGYYFRSGEMVAPFEEAAKALEPNGLSGIVESSYGYHILFRPAMSADHVMDYDDYYQPYTVRDFASAALFNNMAYDWFDAAQVEYNQGFETLDLNDLLA